MDEVQLLKARIQELAKASYNQNRYTFTPFLSPAELLIVDELASDFSYVDFDTFGGNDICERQMVRFGSARTLGYKEEYPIAILLISEP